MRARLVAMKQQLSRAIETKILLRQARREIPRKSAHKSRSRQ